MKALPGRCHGEAALPHTSLGAQPNALTSGKSLSQGLRVPCWQCTYIYLTQEPPFRGLCRYFCQDLFIKKMGQTSRHFSPLWLSTQYFSASSTPLPPLVYKRTGAWSGSPGSGLVPMTLLVPETLTWCQSMGGRRGEEEEQRGQCFLLFSILLTKRLTVSSLAFSSSA